MDLLLKGGMEMKIYFAASIRGGRSDRAIYSQLIDYLKAQGHQVLTEHIGNPDLSSEGQINVSDSEIRNQDIRWLAQSDLMVAETTNPSLGVGYELAYAEKLNVPVIILHRKGQTRLSAMIAGTDYFNAIYYYSDLQEAIDILADYLETEYKG